MSTLHGDLVLRGGHLPEGRRVDVVLSGATVVAVPPPRTAPAPGSAGGSSDVAVPGGRLDG